MSYWPKNWKCRRIAGGGLICPFYDSKGLNEQCLHSSRECIYSSDGELNSTNGIEMRLTLRGSELLGIEDIQVILNA